MITWDDGTQLPPALIQTIAHANARVPLPGHIRLSKSNPRNVEFPYFDRRTQAIHVPGGKISPHALLHEIGHVYDEQSLNDTQRRAITRHVVRSNGNWSPSGPLESSAGHEFVDLYAALARRGPKAYHGAYSVSETPSWRLQLLQRYLRQAASPDGWYDATAQRAKATEIQRRAVRRTTRRSGALMKVRALR